ncbi:MAG: tripartite tricarboxylate transporter substrate binding protein, partial [Variovorax sp.]
MSRFFRAVALACATLAIAAPVHRAAAQTASYPDKPVHLIVAASAGSTSDVLARLVGNELGELIGQPVIVDNRVGASGFIAAEAAARAQPDGYTLMVGSAGIMAINPFIHNKLPYDSQKDYVPVALMASVPNVLVVNAASNVKSVADLVQLSKDTPAGLSYGSLGTGSTTQISAEMFRLAGNLNLVQIPYKGNAQAITDLIAGQINLMFDAIATSLPQIKAGKLRALAVTTTQRTDALPDVPTMEEAGYKDYEMVQWYGVYAPAGTPPEVVQKLSAGIQKALAKPAVRQRIADLGMVASDRGAEAFAKF